jgi:diaminohydroxyphosphoribosylaminopyrimidine deaminase / 5-amino-6-(5-phosphoribosylamino)uracil reductase
MTKSHDSFYMQRALDLAKRGIYTTTPNPNVGCVIVKDEQIIGEGYHYKAGQPHAEVYALNMAGDNAKGATVYVTLEPCSHYGRTPPCANALIEAQVKRVVIAMLDPNPMVSGYGVQRLKEAGIDVDVGLLTEQAEQINRGFLKRMRTGKPFIILKMAASLDGKTAMDSGESKWITSSEARQDVQTLRAKCSAILSTSATVLADDPRLTVRWSAFPEKIKQHYPIADIRQPIRIILDSQHRLTLKEQLFKQQGQIWLIRKVALKGEKLPDNIKIVVDPTPEPLINLDWLFATLAQAQINSIWVEAGAQFAGALIQQNLVDELIIYLAPKLLGHQARSLCKLPHLNQLSDCPTFQFVDVTTIGPDLRLRLKTTPPDVSL